MWNATSYGGLSRIKMSSMNVCEHLEGLDPLALRLPPLLTKEAFIPSSANPWLRAFIIRSSGMAAMRMSLDMTDMIIAFTTNREITGGAENKLPEWANKPVVGHMSTCLGRSSVTAVAIITENCSNCI